MNEIIAIYVVFFQCLNNGENMLFALLISNGNLFFFFFFLQFAIAFLTYKENVSFY